jgi:hypothetical protein
MTKNFHGSGRPPKYNWGKWFDGEIHTLCLGVDIFCASTRNAVAMIFREAKRRNVKVRTNTEDLLIQMQSLGPK